MSGLAFVMLAAVLLGALNMGAGLFLGLLIGAHAERRKQHHRRTGKPIARRMFEAQENVPPRWRSSRQ